MTNQPAEERLAATPWLQAQPQSYEAAQEAYSQHRFAEAKQLLQNHLNQQPDDARALLLQGYVAFYGFQNESEATASYRKLLSIKADEQFKVLAIDGLRQCGVTDFQVQQPPAALKRNPSPEPEQLPIQVPEPKPEPKTWQEPEEQPLQVDLQPTSAQVINSDSLTEGWLSVQLTKN
jgi:tetratricopeptide (TPR) repeat protein